MKYNNINTKILYILIISVLSTFLILSCGKKEEKPAPEKTKEEIPQNLKTIGENTENIIKEIEGVLEKKENPEKIESEMKQEENESNTNENEQDKSQEENNGENSNGNNEENQKEGESKEKQGEKSKEKTPAMILKEEEQKMWEETNKMVKTIHTAWNDYELKAIEDGSSGEEIDSFEKALNELTMAIDEKDYMKSMNKANEVTLHMARFLDFYKGNIDGEMHRIKYYVRRTYFDGKNNKWEEASQNISKVDPILDRLGHKIELEEKDKKLLEKLDLSIQDIANVIYDKNKELLKIKRDIALKNLKAIEEAAK